MATVAQDGDLEDMFSVNLFIDEIVGLVQKENWDEVLNQLQQEAHRQLSMPESFHRLGGIVMGSACYKESVPLLLYQVVIEVTGTEAATYQDAGLRTPLHMVLMYLDRPDIVQFLVETAPNTVHMHDHGGLCPIDILSQKILMKEERMRYLKKAVVESSPSQVNEQEKQQLDAERKLLQDCWECARVLCLAHGGELQSNPKLPLLHSCCLGYGDIPLSLLQSTLRKNRFQLRLQDDLRRESPLHIIARRFVVRIQDDDDEEEDESSLLEEICNAHPQAAGVVNGNGQYPLDLAIAAGRKWRSGCRCLAKAYPLALLHDVQLHDSQDEYGEGERRFLQLLLSQLGREEFIHDMVFQILRVRPQILFSSEPLRNREVATVFASSPGD